MLEGKQLVEKVLSAIRSQLSSGDEAASVGSLADEISSPDDGTAPGLWEQLSEQLEEYSRTGERVLLWQAAGVIQRLARWYLQRPVTLVSGIGEKRAEKLENIDVKTIEDLLYHFPRAYTDRRYVDDISSISREKNYTIYGEVLAAEVVRGRNPRFKLRLGDDTGYLRINFWNQAYLDNQINRGDWLFCYGEVEFYRGTPQMNNPEFDRIDSTEELEDSRGVKPVYPLTEGVSQRQLRGWVADAVEFSAELFLDGLPPEVRKNQSLPPLSRSLKQVHQPDSLESLDRARHRLIFEEFFYFQLIFALHNWKVETLAKDRSYPEQQWRDQFISSLPFQLTSDQQQALSEIEKDLCSSAPVHRLLQGDVGTGKTVVATAALLRAAANGYQTALMAPTEVLAEQHFSTLKDYLSDLPCEIELLTGSLDTAEKQALQQRINTGDVDFVVGTHALFQEAVKFSKLGFVVIDEQHRFGVQQRRDLREKGPEVDMLIMSATPIPRSLALTVYGDLEVSSLEEFPRRERRIETEVLDKTKINRRRVYQEVRDLIEAGERAFFVFPAIEENDDSDLTAAETAFDKAEKSELFSSVDLGLLHGQMDHARKQAVMEKFRNGEIQLLFSTTVVEVGVDVPEASCLVVFEAEHFGLAQLHQLRGRIGRAGQQAYCFLLISTDVAPGSQERLQVLEETEDGFEVARRDLQFRGIGKPTGTSQSGWQEFQLGDIWEDRELMQKARREADQLVEESDGLNQPDLVLTRQKLEAEYKEQMQFARIG